MHNQILRTTNLEDGLDQCWWKMEALSLMFSEQIILIGACLHQEQDLQSHNFVACHVKECDILTQFKRWKGGQNIKLEGSDHAPVYTSLLEIPSVSQHSTPSLSVRYIPMVGGLQQTHVSLLMKR